jgi:D-alanyl-lipoteichoic acid acyltransferase DltB (MBOAT superfamily)
LLFNSYEFIFIFLPLTFFVYFYLNKKKLTVASRVWIVATSLFFYSWWNIYYLPIIVSSVVFNFTIGSYLSNSKNKYKNVVLIFSILANLSLLAYFKYADFLIENLNIVYDINIESLNLILPLAISFFTFQQIAYLVDSVKGQIKEHNFLNYIVFVTFFPQLIAGPIVHHKEMMPQFSNMKSKTIDYKNISNGLFIFSIGLFKKVVIADTFAIWASHGFDNTSVLNFYEAWATSLSYTFQLYFDFSGYADMAIGLALLFNIRLPINFNSPYKATNIQDFWRRWHITLSRFLRDYIYIPMGGSKKGKRKTYFNLMATFIIGGIWHGAGWTFIFWGFIHGLAIVIHRIWSKLQIKLYRPISWFLTFNFVNISWVFFRAKDWDDAIKVISGMFGGDLKFNINYIQIFIIALSLLIVILFKNSMEHYNEKFNFTFDKVFIFAFLFTVSIITIRLRGASEFLYFNF